MAMAVSRPAKKRSLGWCLAIDSTNTAPSPEGETPVVSTTLPPAQASATGSAVVLLLDGGVIKIFYLLSLDCLSLVLWQHLWSKTQSKKLDLYGAISRKTLPTSL